MHAQNMDKQEFTFLRKLRRPGIT